MPLLPDRSSLYTIANTFRFVGLFMVIAGFIYMIGLIFWYNSAITTHAEVLGIIEDKAGNQKLLLSFTDQDGEEYEVAVRSGSLNADIASNQPIEILYQKGNPQRVEINRFWDKWFLPGFLMIWGELMWLLLSLAAQALSPTAMNGQKPDDAT